MHEGSVHAVDPGLAADWQWCVDRTEYSSYEPGSVVRGSEVIGESP